MSLRSKIVWRFQLLLLRRKRITDTNSEKVIFCTAETADMARAVEKHYKELGMRSGYVSENDSANMIYCYAVTPTTTEQ